MSMNDIVNVCEKPHQNTKKGKAPSYTRTKASVVRNTGTNLTLIGPEEVVFQATREAGEKDECNS